MPLITLVPLLSSARRALIVKDLHLDAKAIEEVVRLWLATLPDEGSVITIYGQNS
jgi:hypothetical protein